MPSLESLAIRRTIQKEMGPSELPLAEQRNGWIEYARTQQLHKNVDSREESIAGVPCLWLSSKRSKSKTTIIYLHGGGLVDGAIITHRELVSRLVGITGHRALMVEYRLMPEHPFPAPLEDVLSVCRALKSTHEIEAKDLVLGGDSSGGGLAISALMKLACEGDEMPACVFSISGTFDMTLSAKSMTSRDKLDPCLSYAALKGWIRDFDGLDLSDADISPIYGNARGLPPILLQVGDHEVWRDDSKRMAEKIEQSGGEAYLKIWDSMWHVWPMYADLPEALEAIQCIGDFIDQHINNRANEQ